MSRAAIGQRGDFRCGPPDRRQFLPQGLIRGNDDLPIEDLTGPHPGGITHFPAQPGIIDQSGKCIHAGGNVDRRGLADISAIMVIGLVTVGLA